MTQKELNEMAILKAKADKAQRDAEKAEVKAEKAEKAEVKAEKAEKAEVKVDIKKYPFDVKLGENKTIHFKPWTGKTKKKFRKVFEKLEDINDLDFDDVVRVLIRDNVSDYDVYLSDSEQQYLTALLRKESIADEFEFDSECEYCQSLQHIKTSVTESVEYTMNQFPKKLNNTEFIDIKSQSLLKDIEQDIINSQDYDGITQEKDIEFALHINNNKSPLETLDWIDDLPLKDISVVYDNLKSVSSEMTMKVQKHCTECGKESNFIAQEIPGLFESLLQ